ncbi:MAG: DUF4178 domain-containing protein [Bacteroidota bacterium]
MPEPHHCPSCGAPLRIPSRYVKVVACEFCGTVSLFDGARLDPTGRSAGLAELPSALYVDATGTIAERPFRVLGRLMLEYDGGVWNEWFLDLGDAGRAWLVEDEGEFTVMQEEETASVPPFESVAPGETVQIGGRDVFVREVGEATVVGGEGRLGAEILPGEVIGYVDGSADGREVSVEYGERVTEVFVGQAVPRAALVIDEEVYG